jgi:hypothetical protein
MQGSCTSSEGPRAGAASSEQKIDDRLGVVSLKAGIAHELRSVASGAKSLMPLASNFESSTNDLPRKSLLRNSWEDFGEDVKSTAKGVPAGVSSPEASRVQNPRRFRP